MCHLGHINLIRLPTPRNQLYCNKEKVGVLKTGVLKTGVMKTGGIKIGFVACKTGVMKTGALLRLMTSLFELWDQRRKKIRN